MPTILVTGGAGYIGSHCVKQLMAEGWSVVILDDLSTGYRRFVLSEHFVEGHTTDRDLVIRVLKDYSIDAVMHFAANAYVGESVENPEKYYFNNVYGTLQLLSAMREVGVEPFIFSSSCAVYGVPNQLPITENTPLNPMSPYGFSKRVVEAMLADFSHAYGLRYVSLRYFNAAGADPDGNLGECHDPETHLIPLVLQAASGERSSISIFGSDYDTRDGTCVRDYIHINDIGKAHLLALKYLQEGGKSEVFNIGSETGHSVREIITTCQEVSGKNIPVQEAPRRPGDPPALVASAEKIKSVLGWQPEFADIRSVIETAWSWEQQKHRVMEKTIG